MTDGGGETVETASDAAATAELQREFWVQVVVFNVALFTFSLGVMLVGFRGQWTLGGALVAVGVASFLRGYRRLRAVRAGERNR
jgi:hypothetical protein